ncbi:glycerol kinase GlpK [Ottowia sp.]|uniref:glycerol kinase GlpK n=1 Tax=Ottowia sp. TaxID=1898956 RepID=UPI002C3F171B|nr:glycerol kinase GlpK [Ottowia sp.]HOB66448.1 glycerol kinase GlpK [Ottowia sp.]HPZ56449.1 glycerol kinase GlpK [Ottowia sp.]HQD48930.1 glycerol kinase GlpK [Ottowia sp.]
MRYLLALDQGTTSSRAIAFDERGRVAAVAQREFTQHFPQPGWVEHDAAEIWATQWAVARECMQKLAAAQAGQAQSAIEIVAIGITNQRETTVLWDRATGEPVARAIVWQDRRTTARCEALRHQGKAGLIQRKTGLVLDAYFSATKLEWLLDQTPGARARAEAGELAFGTVDSWLIWNLTGGPCGGVHATDPSNASRTLLMNLHTLDWDDELLRLFHIPRAVLPRIVPSSGVLGETAPGVLGEAPIPIAGVAGDQQAATFGQACFAPGMAKNTYGTGCFMLMNTGSVPVASRNRLLTTVGWQGPTAEWGARTAYCLEGSVFMAGATVQWLRDGLQMIRSAPEVEALAASVENSGDVFLVPAFAGLGAPDWDGRARGTLVGLTRGTTRAHIARAALEAIALQSADLFGAMSRDSGIALTELRVDGGASRNDLLMQLQADLAGVPVVRPRVTETTALGAAYLAGLATGVWAGGADIAEQWAMDRRFEPRLPEPARRQRIARWREAVDRARGWARDDVA